MHIYYKYKHVPLLNSLINCILTRLMPQISSKKDECTSRFSNFLIIDLCISLANSKYKIFSILTSPSESFLSKRL